MGELEQTQAQSGDSLVLAEKDSRKKKKRADLKPTTRLAFDQTYRCPACGSGEMSAIAMMDVFACDFCQHMFTANLQTQSVHLADSLQPMAWQWNGWRWQTAQQSDTAAIFIWTFAGVLTAAPVGIIAISNYVFPPLEGSNFPLTWIGLTLLSHSLMSGWLLAEYHRWPWYVGTHIRFQRWREQWFGAQAA